MIFENTHFETFEQNVLFFWKIIRKKKKSNMVSYFLQLWYQFENNNSPFVDNDVIVATKGD